MTVEAAISIGRLSCALGRSGYTVTELDDFGQVQELVAQAEKSYLTPFSSTAHNDFTEGNALWLVAWQGDEPAFLGCARLEDIGSEPVGRYWERAFGRAYRSGVVGDVRPDISRAMAGRLCYFGDLYVNSKFRGSRSMLRAFVTLGHLAVSLKWSPDYTYCFLKEKDVMRGSAAMYGFPHLYPLPFTWIDPPEGRGLSEWLAVVSGAEVKDMARATLASIESAG